MPVSQIQEKLTGRQTTNTQNTQHVKSDTKARDLELNSISLLRTFEHFKPHTVPFWTFFFFLNHKCIKQKNVASFYFLLGELWTSWFQTWQKWKPGQSVNVWPLHFDWQCHICKRVMNHKTRVKGKLTQQLTGDWYIELEVFNLAAELTWSLYNKLQCLQGNTSPDGSPSAFPVFSPSPFLPMRDLVESLEYRLQVLCSLNDQDGWSVKRD